MPTTDPYAALTTTNVAVPQAPGPAQNASAAEASTTNAHAVQASLAGTATNQQASTALAGPARQATATGYTAAQTGEAAQGTAALRTVQSNETVQGQLAGLIDSNSPLLQRARARANDEMNTRGLVNSSMAIGAADAAMYDVAVPIAQFDAGVYGQAAKDNQSLLTQVSMFNAGEKNTQERFNVGETNKASAFTADAQNTTSRFNVDQANTTERFNTEQANVQERFNVGEANTTSRFNAGEANKLSMFNAGEMNRVSISNAEQANANARQNAQLITQTNIANADAFNKQQLAVYDNAVKIAIQNADAANKNTLVRLDGVVKQQLAEIEAQYKNEMQASATAATMYQTSMQQVTAIMTNPDIPADKKPEYIQSILNMTKGGMDTASAMTDLDLGKYVDAITVKMDSGSGTGTTNSGSGAAGASGASNTGSTGAAPQQGATREPDGTGWRLPDGRFQAEDGSIYGSKDLYEWRMFNLMNPGNPG